MIPDQILIFTVNRHYSKQGLIIRTFSLEGHILHELGLTQSIIDLAIEYATRENAKKVSSITVEIGSISGVIPEAVEFAFDVCSKETLVEGAALHINHINGQGRCLDCKEISDIDFPTHICPNCGNLSLEIVQGKEMKFIEMEID